VSGHREVCDRDFRGGAWNVLWICEESYFIVQRDDGSFITIDVGSFIAIVIFLDEGRVDRIWLVGLKMMDVVNFCSCFRVIICNFYGVFCFNVIVGRICVSTCSGSASCGTVKQIY